ncbi:YqaE/Pmp3 family membrane protein [Pantanalinema rosaneae CENA516]|uniref:YqaE/Pmp3 family membrane protein n=1 Tax=Pantanalinema rosaneae TaxID=1620701 RepID=UPI003D6F56F6
MAVNNTVSTSRLLRLILAVFLPPLGVFLTFGFNVTFLINIGLTLLGWLPGSIHALWAIAKHEENYNRQLG